MNKDEFRRRLAEALDDVERRNTEKLKQRLPHHMRPKEN